MANDKWEMFKNYMHNELGITKDDIRAWIKEAAEEQANRLVQQEFGKIDIAAKIVSIIFSGYNDYGCRLREQLIREVAKKITLGIKE